MSFLHFIAAKLARSITSLCQQCTKLQPFAQKCFTSIYKLCSTLSTPSSNVVKYQAEMWSGADKKAVQLVSLGNGMNQSLGFKVSMQQLELEYWGGNSKGNSLNLYPVLVTCILPPTQSNLKFVPGLKNIKKKHRKIAKLP